MNPRSHPRVWWPRRSAVQTGDIQPGGKHILGTSGHGSEGKHTLVNAMSSIMATSPTGPWRSPAPGQRELLSGFTGSHERLDATLSPTLRFPATVRAPSGLPSTKTTPYRDRCRRWTGNYQGSGHALANILRQRQMFTGWDLPRVSRHFAEVRCRVDRPFTPKVNVPHLAVAATAAGHDRNARYPAYRCAVAGMRRKWGNDRGDLKGSAYGLRSHYRRAQGCSI
jgi:hypothetical protein